MCEFFRKNCLGLQNFLPQSTEPHQPGLSVEFLLTTYGCGKSPFCLSAPPTSLDGCGFFNFIVVGFPFNSISVSSEWWFFCILVVILMWLCEEVSCVCLCHELDQKSWWVLMREQVSVRLKNVYRLILLSVTMFLTSCFLIFFYFFKVFLQLQFNHIQIHDWKSVFPVVLIFISSLPCTYPHKPGIQFLETIGF